MQLYGLTLDEFGLEGLDPEPVKGRGAVEENRVFADHLFEDVPHLGLFALDHAL